MVVYGKQLLHTLNINQNEIDLKSLAETINYIILYEFKPMHYAFSFSIQLMSQSGEGGIKFQKTLYRPPILFINAASKPSCTLNYSRHDNTAVVVGRL